MSDRNRGILSNPLDDHGRTIHSLSVFQLLEICGLSHTSVDLFNYLLAHNPKFGSGRIDESACRFGSEIVPVVFKCDEGFPFSTGNCFEAMPLPSWSILCLASSHDFLHSLLCFPPLQPALEMPTPYIATDVM